MVSFLFFYFLEEVLALAPYHQNETAFIKLQKVWTWDLSGSQAVHRAGRPAFSFWMTLEARLHPHLPSINISKWPHDLLSCCWVMNGCYLLTSRFVLPLDGNHRCIARRTTHGQKDGASTRLTAVHGAGNIVAPPGV
ncbi:hypothetical protein BD289DRAFT_148575 [Coniella lustricola]|uniref:Secreted protein n=1 Tax=Coniella lustricola TaxID=2025994 RepID=A0A2T2ZUY3_9PEZI|nr:hypothetical protein BD289DRAFT_148575 [Coniella lustricola]